MTTHKTIIELVKEGKIKTLRPKDKPYRDYLVVNEENEFNKIYNSLSEIENIIDLIEEPFRKFPMPALMPPLTKADFDTSNEFSALMEDYLGTFHEAIPILIQELLTRTDNKIYSEKDKQILNSRILQIQQKYIAIRGEETTDKKLGFFMARLGHVDPKAPFLARVKKNNPDFLNECNAVARKFETLLRNFKNQYISDRNNERKTKIRRHISG